MSAYANQKQSVSAEYAITAPLASKSLLLDAISKQGRLVVVGERGHILISKDGDTWQQAKVPTRSTLTSVFFHSENLGWAVGHDTVILRTADGGHNWERVYYTPEEEMPLLDIWFRDQNNGIALGAYGLYLTSNDGGKNWAMDKLKIVNNVLNNEDSTDTEKLDADDFGALYELHLNSIAQSKSGKLYIAAEAGHVYRSDDAGDTWLELPSPYIGSLFGVLPLNNDSILAFGLRGHMFRSEDAGYTWTEIMTHTQEMLTNGIRLNDGTVIIVGLGGTLLISRDDGKSFSLRELGTRNSYAAIIQNTKKELFIIGDNGVEKLGNIP